MKTETLWEFVQFAIGTRQSFEPEDDLDWNELYDFSKKQAISGVMFSGVERLPKSMMPPKKLLLKWYSLVDRIEQKNRLMNKRCGEISKLFKEKGFQTCILKGQGNAEMYPQPLRRQAGDIDVWVDGHIRDIIDCMRSLTDKALDITYHHTDFPIWADTPVEVHYRPIWLNSPWRNHRLQKWFQQHAPRQYANWNETLGYAKPTTDFNMVYQLLHVFHHYMEEGVGFRQIVDYYYLLLQGNAEERQEAMRAIKRMGLKRFAGAMMYVLKVSLDLPEEKMLCLPNSKSGDLLLSEILLSGNFGKYDNRNEAMLQKTGLTRKFWQSKRLVHLLLQYPEETVCAPFRATHVLWRKLRLWRYE